MKVLVSGRQSTVGRNLISYFEEKGWETLGLDPLDATSPVTLEKKFRSFEPTHVAHVSWPHRRVLRTKLYEAFATALMSTLHLLEGSVKHDVERFVFLDSYESYGWRPETSPVNEDAPRKPESIFGRSKVAGAMVVEQYMADGLPACILTSWRIFGPGQRPMQTPAKEIRMALNDEEIPLTCFGKQVFDLSHVVNLCHAFELAFTKDAAMGERFNVGSGEAFTLEHIIQKIISMIPNCKARIKLEPARRGEVEMRSFPGIDKINKLLGYEPLMPTYEGLHRVIESMKGGEENG